jgi:outer membrane protein
MIKNRRETMVKRFLGLIVLTVCLALSTEAFAKELKIGSVDMRKVFYEYKKTKDFNAKLEKEDAKLKEEADKRTQDIRKLKDEIDLLSEEAQEKRQPELRQKIKELDDFKKEKVEKFLREKDDMFKEIRKDILSASDNYAKKNGYDLLFDEAVFVYATKDYDITDTILKELNK